MNTTMRQQINLLELNTPITHYCFGKPWYPEEFNGWYADKEPGKVYQFIGNEHWLDIRFDSGHGGEDQPPMYLWTEDFVIVVSCYDGATGLEKVNRNPVDCNPRSIGGG